MAGRPGVAMLSPEEDFNVNKLRTAQQKNKKKNIVFPTTGTPRTEIQPGDFAYDLRPMLQLQKLTGHFPLHTNDAGDVEFRLFSFLTLYTALMQGIMLTGGALIWRHRIDYLIREGPDFAQAMIEATFLGAFTSLFLSPFVQLPESGKTAKYVSSWADYQREYEAVVGRPLDLNLRRSVTLRIAFIILVCSGMTSFPFVTLKEIRPWFALPFFYCLCSCVLNTGMWHINGRALVTAARTLMEQIERLLSTCEFNCEDKIAEYRMLWLKLSKLTQDKGSSMGLTFGTQVIAYFVEQVFAVYGLLSNLQEGFVMNNIVFVSCGLTFSWLLYVTCNTAQNATEEVGINMQERLQKLFHKIPRHFADSRQEVRFFIQTIVENPPKINFCGFVLVNRGLQTSLTSSMVTYLVVLTQFQISADSTINKNATCNISEM